MSRHAARPSIPDLSAIARAVARATDPQTACESLIDELSRKKLLVRVRGRGVMMMAHRTFAEFLAARFLAYRIKEQGWARAQVPWIEEEVRAGTI